MDITSLVDGLYWGVLISTMLFGITISQGWTYVHNNNDKWPLRLFVAVLMWVRCAYCQSDSTRLCLQPNGFCYYMLELSGSPVLLDVQFRESRGAFGTHANHAGHDRYHFYHNLLVRGGVSLVCRNVDLLPCRCTLFFASRVYLLDKRSPWAAAIAALFAIGHFVTISSLLDGCRKDPRISHLSSPQMKFRLGLGLAFSLISVTIITIVLAMKLSSARTSIKTTRTLLQQLFLFVVTRGLLVTLNSIAFLIAYEMKAATMMWAPFLLFNPKLHVISMVALLNARKYPSDETMISVGNVSGTPSRNPNLFMSKSDTDGSRDINPRTLHLRGLSDGGQRFIQHPMPSLTHQDKHEVLEISVEKSVQVTRS